MNFKILVLSLNIARMDILFLNTQISRPQVWLLFFYWLKHVYHVILLQSQQFVIKSITWLYHWVVSFTGIVTNIYTAYLRNETDMDTTVIFPLDSEMEELSKGFDERHAFNVSYGTSKLKRDIATVSIDKFLLSLSLSLMVEVMAYNAYNKYAWIEFEQLH